MSFPYDDLFIFLENGNFFQSESDRLVVLIIESTQDTSYRAAVGAHDHIYYCCLDNCSNRGIRFSRQMAKAVWEHLSSELGICYVFMVDDDHESFKRAVQTPVTPAVGVITC